MKKVLIPIVTIIILAIAWWLVSPLFIDKTVNEDLGFEFGDVLLTHEEIENMTTEEMKEMEMQLLETAAEMDDRMIKDTTPEVTLEPMVRQGNFVGSDDFHQASGIALAITTDEQQVIRFEDLDVTNGPDLRVYLSTEENPTAREGLGDFVELGKLKGNMGNQNYEIPASIDLDQYKSVVIYCKPFHVVFGSALLK